MAMVNIRPKLKTIHTNDVADLALLARSDVGAVRYISPHAEAIKFFCDNLPELCTKDAPQFASYHLHTNAYGVFAQKRIGGRMVDLCRSSILQEAPCAKDPRWQLALEEIDKVTHEVTKLVVERKLDGDCLNLDVLHWFSTNKVDIEHTDKGIFLGGTLCKDATEIMGEDGEDYSFTFFKNDRVPHRAKMLPDGKTKAQLVFNLC